jgi:hypothetical protein
VILQGTVLLDGYFGHPIVMAFSTGEVGGYVLILTAEWNPQVPRGGLYPWVDGWDPTIMPPSNIGYVNIPDSDLADLKPLWPDEDPGGFNR